MNAKTELEAWKLWCPFVRYQIDTNDQPSNRAGHADGVGTNPWNKCIGSGCMMWRWGREPDRRRRMVSPELRAATVAPARPEGLLESWEFQPAEVDDGIYAAWVEPADEAATRRTGHCGLAGEP